MSQELFNKNNGDAEDIWDDTAMIEMYEKSKSATMEKVKLSASQTQGKTREWKVDDTCMAPYEDGRWYPAKVLSLDGETCRVVYTEYDEEADVNVADLLRPDDEAVLYGQVDQESTHIQHGEYYGPFMAEPPNDLQNFGYTERYQLYSHAVPTTSTFFTTEFEDFSAKPRKQPDLTNGEYKNAKNEVVAEDFSDNHEEYTWNADQYGSEKPKESTNPQIQRQFFVSTKVLEKSITLTKKTRVKVKRQGSSSDLLENPFKKSKPVESSTTEPKIEEIDRKPKPRKLTLFPANIHPVKDVKPTLELPPLTLKPFNWSPNFENSKSPENLLPDFVFERRFCTMDKIFDHANARLPGSGNKARLFSYAFEKLRDLRTDLVLIKNRVVVRSEQTFVAKAFLGPRSRKLIANRVATTNLFLNTLNSGIIENFCSEEAVEKDAVDKMDTNEEEKPGPSTEQKPTTSKLFPIPSICPPPPALFAKIAKSSNEKEALTNMLMSWYMSGYHTGFYEGFKEAQKSVQLGKRK
ncbi:unnamed protein product [Bursaphelenchus xylophilus]|uniref:(pine wood nematode) hypothetical protein n=1 Tax=Bursaphelenchus xylophilus TaxID=6326 RepID=A0A1I7S8K1_BURXY|nr:unnamed protein product [Bursaphelenchus xylophilus]CAG9089593.1 unnamed protein product [Bursaphelenchus xylophilus]